MYDPSKYQKMWKHNPHLRHIPVYLYIGSDQPPPPPHETSRLNWTYIQFDVNVGTVINQHMLCSS